MVNILKKLIMTALLTSFLTIQSLNVFAQSESQEQAEILLATAGVKQSLEQSIEQMLQIQIQQSPDLLPYKATMQAFFEKYMGYESLKSDLVKIYTDAFTAEELKDINAFYSTKTGKKTLAAMPQLMNQSAQLGVQRVQANLQELDAMIANRAEELKEQKEKAEQDK